MPSPSHPLVMLLRKWCMLAGISLIILLRISVCLEGASSISIVLTQANDPHDTALAQELADKLQRLYPNEKFAVGDTVPETGKIILLGRSSDARIKTLLGENVPSTPESYRVTTKSEDAREWGVIAGADARGLAYGTYGLLQNLGYGFYLTYDGTPSAKDSPFSWEGWQLADRPLTPDRLVFNWHNFLSGCSTWDFPEWQSWIRQSRKMGYNGIMVHAYGNNPMVRFQFNGHEKPLGYLTTTVRGRDWGTMHVNDVRRLQGGEVFSHPVFGAQAGQVAEDKRSDAARQLMQTVFAEAAAHSMNIFFSIDADTPSANPQELIQTLPENARFTRRTGKTWIANPDTPEGYQFYKEQVRQLFADYPQITCLALWFRENGSLLSPFQLSDLPVAWQAEYRETVARHPEAAAEWRSAGCFVLGKITHAWQRALRELGLARVRLAAGSWNFHFLPACDRFFPADVTLMGLDYDIIHHKSWLDTPERQKALAATGARRPLIPIIWAHHDDGHYIGRSYEPFEKFHDKLAQTKSAGFGIIHWTNRPFDLFFSSHSRQVWERTQNEALSSTCRDFSAKSFGLQAEAGMAGYLEKWVTEAPIFARETGPAFIDRRLGNSARVTERCQERIRMIDAMLQQGSPTTEQQSRMRYWRGLENFIATFFQAHENLQLAQAAHKAGKFAEAREWMAKARPEAVLEQYARFSAQGGITRGDEGLLVSLNTRWFSYFVEMRQALGMEPIRVSCGPTSHDPLAQSPGNWTFFIDQNGAWWQRLGARMLNGQAFEFPQAENEIGRTGIFCEKPTSFKIQPMLYRRNVEAGKYRVRLFFSDPYATAAGKNNFKVSLGGITKTIDVFKETGAQGKVLEKTFEIELKEPEKLRITLTPLSGKALISGVVLEPID